MCANGGIILIGVCVLTRIWLFGTPWTVTRQALLSMEPPRQEHGVGLSFPTPAYIPNARIEPMFPVTPALADRFLTSEPSGVLSFLMGLHKNIKLYE